MYSEIPNVRIKTICDVDERLFPNVVKTIVDKFGAAPETQVDFRKLQFNSDKEKFVNDAEADKLLTRE